MSTERRNVRTRLWMMSVCWVVVMASIWINVFARSQVVRGIALISITTGMALICAIGILGLLRALKLLLDAESGLHVPPRSETRMSRLNRLADDNQALVEALSKVVIPFAVATMAFLGVILTVALK